MRTFLSPKGKIKFVDHAGKILKLHPGSEVYDSTVYSGIL